VQRTLFAKTIAVAACFAAPMFSCASVSHAQTPPPAGSPPISQESVPALREVTDELGRTIRIPQTLHRVVSLAPSVTETIYALGLQDRLVGDTDYCDFPAEAQQKPKVGGVINPSLEAIAALHPDLVLVTKVLNRLDTVNSLANLGIPSYATNPHTVADIISSTQRLADLMGVSEAGSALTKDIERRLADTQQRVAPFPRSRVLFVVWPQPLFSIGKDTFIADALQYAGAVSIVESQQSWPQVSLEEVARSQPDFLVFAGPHSEATPVNVDTLSDLPGWRILDAVRNHRYARTSDALDRPAPRIASAIEDLAKQFHPEAFVEKPDAAPEQKDKVHPPTTPPSVAPPQSSRNFTREDPGVPEARACGL
jgi:iron complex transport system substrate-binding protein